jgi:signal transduction histidine kinase
MATLSLRRSFVGLWLGWTLVALAVAGLTLAVFERGSAALIAKGRMAVGDACAAAGARYRLLAASGAGSDTAAGRNRDMAVVMQASLYQFPGMEGSLWRPDKGFFGYAYPTYEGPAPKLDLPEAERQNIQSLVNEVAHDRTVHLTERRGLREAVITAACPLEANDEDGTVAWTMLRVPLSAGGEYDRLALAGGLLLLFLVGSGTWVAWLGLRWSRAFAGVERALEVSGSDAPRDIAATGLQELDRVVLALNRFGTRLDEARREAASLAAKASQLDRLTALGRVAAGLAHEIRNPIAAMRLKAENALAGPSPRQERALQAILGQIARLDRLLAEMLAFAQPVTLQQNPVAVAAFAVERIETMRERADAAGVVLEVRADEATCRFDAEQLGRALDNLLINAFQHTPRGGRVTLTACLSGADLVVTVADSGPGIDPAMVDRLFEPFATSRADGTGLGLSIVREIATAHGGSVAAMPSDAGALFVVKLPCRPS